MFKLSYSWLNSKEIKKISAGLEDNFGCKFDFKGYGVCINSKNKLYIVNREIAGINLDYFVINSTGLYFGEKKEDGSIRLSIEGAQLVGKDASKNIIELNDDDAFKFFRGHDIEGDFSYKGFVIVKRGEDILGCSCVKNGKLLNFLPKERRIKSSD